MSRVALSEESAPAILKAVRSVPRGKVATYGQVATLAGLPGRARLVARVLRLAADPKLPWHRIVGRRAAKRAQVSIPDPEGAELQRRRLEREGVRFTDTGAIALDIYGWLPTDP